MNDNEKMNHNEIKLLLELDYLLTLLKDKNQKDFFKKLTKDRKTKDLDFSDILLLVKFFECASPNVRKIIGECFSKPKHKCLS